MGKAAPLRRVPTVGLDAVELHPKPGPYQLPVLPVASVPSLGALVPGALAARMAYPDRLVVAFEDPPIIVLVFDDREIGLIHVKQEIKGLAAHRVQLGDIDWKKLAQSFP